MAYQKSFDAAEFDNRVARVKARNPVGQETAFTDLRMALAAGVTGTPTIALNGKPIAGFETYEALRQEIRSAIEEARK